MAKITKVPDGMGGEADAVEIQYEVGTEPWCEYKLLDSGRVRIRTTASKIFRLLDATGQPAFTTDGDPSVHVKYNVQITGSE